MNTYKQVAPLKNIAAVNSTKSQIAWISRKKRCRNVCSYHKRTRK